MLHDHKHTHEAEKMVLKSHTMSISTLYKDEVQSQSGYISTPLVVNIKALTSLLRAAAAGPRSVGSKESRVSISLVAADGYSLNVSATQRL